MYAHMLAFKFFPLTSFLRPACLATMSVHLNQGAYLKCLKRLLSVPFVVAVLTTVSGSCTPPPNTPSALTASLWTSAFAHTQTCMQIVTWACPLSLRACECLRACVHAHAHKTNAFAQMHKLHKGGCNKFSVRFEIQHSSPGKMKTSSDDYLVSFIVLCA